MRGNRILRCRLAVLRCCCQHVRVRVGRRRKLVRRTLVGLLEVLDECRIGLRIRRGAPRGADNQTVCGRARTCNNGLRSEGVGADDLLLVTRNAQGNEQRHTLGRQGGDRNDVRIRRLDRRSDCSKIDRPDWHELGLQNSHTVSGNRGTKDRARRGSKTIAALNHHCRLGCQRRGRNSLNDRRQHNSFGQCWSEDKRADLRNPWLRIRDSQHGDTCGLSKVVDYQSDIRQGRPHQGRDVIAEEDTVGSSRTSGSSQIVDRLDVHLDAGHGARIDLLGSEIDTAARAESVGLIWTGQCECGTDVDRDGRGDSRRDEHGESGHGGRGDKG